MHDFRHRSALRWACKTHLQDAVDLCYTLHNKLDQSLDIDRSALGWACKAHLQDAVDLCYALYNKLDQSLYIHTLLSALLHLQSLVGILAEQIPNLFLVDLQVCCPHQILAMLTCKWWKLQWANTSVSGQGSSQAGLLTCIVKA